MKYITALVVSLSLICCISADAQYASVKTVTIVGGPSFDYPSHWSVMETAATENVAHYSKGIAKDAGVDLSNITKVERVAIVSQPLPSAAKIRGYVVLAPDMDVSIFKSFSDSELELARAELEEALAQVSGKMGVRVECEMPRLGVYAGRTSLILSYTRFGENSGDVWYVEQTKIPFDGGCFGLTTSYLVSQKQMMVPILEEVKRSVKF